MSNDLQDIFKKEVTEYLQALSDHLLTLEMGKADDRSALLSEMHRMAHSMKGAAQAMGYTIITDVSLLLEKIFKQVREGSITLTPEMGDTLLDGLDLIQTSLDNQSINDALVDAVKMNLDAIANSQATANGSKKALTDSSEMEVITDEMLAVAEADDTQPLQASEHVSEDLLRIFQGEVTEYLSVLNTGILQVEMATVDDREMLIREMNRVAHSMKGAAHSVGLTSIEAVSHYFEDFFQKMLAGVLDITPQVADGMYDGLDLIQKTIDGESISDELLATVLMQLSQIAEGRERGHRDTPLSGDDPVPPAEETPEIMIPPALMTTSMETVSTSTMVLRPAEESLRVSVSKLDQLMADTSELLVARLQGENRHKRLDRIRRDHVKWQREWRSIRSAYIRLARQMQEENDELSDDLLKIFQFLQANENHLARSNRDLSALHQTLAQDNMQLATLGDQLQDRVSRLRMMPFESIVAGFQRMARDVARDVGKQLHFEITGASVDIDKTVLDALKDPLMHLLRNAIDHGLDSPEARQRLGKSPIGKVQLSVEQRGSEIMIQVRDDGRGLNTARIREQAIKRNILTAQEIQQYDDDDINMLIFQSGLTTTDTVTTLSGRGLGMDIVRTRVESLRGRVSIESVENKGTTITINVPVSLTRLRVITLRVGAEQYAIPARMIERMETIPAHRIYTAEGQEMLNINDRPTPLISLGALLGTSQLDTREEMLQIIAIRTAERMIAFEVDELFTEIELVLKSLGEELANAPFVAGAALLGSGDVILVLDANDVVRRANQVNRQPIPTQKSQPTSSSERALHVLVVDDSITTRTLEKNILEAVGFNVSVAIDGAEAWQRITEDPPDVIVSDVEMPNMTGLDLARRVKSTDYTADIPIILLTSLSKPEQREAGLKAGADAYLVKSQFDQAELLATIQSVL